MTDTAPARIHLLFGYTEPLGQTMRMWQDEPFDGSTEYVRADAPTSAESDVDLLAMTISRLCWEQSEGGWQPSIPQAMDMARAALAAMGGENE